MLIMCPIYDAPAWCQSRGPDEWIVTLKHPERNQWTHEHRSHVPFDRRVAVPHDLELARIVWEDVENSGVAIVGKDKFYKACAIDLAKRTLKAHDMKPAASWAHLGCQLVEAILDTALKTERHHESI